jgi:ATP-dependent DNA ligase
VNRLATLIARLETLNDADMKAAFVADYLSETAEPDQAFARNLLEDKLKTRPVKLALIRGLAEARIDPTLFGLAQAYTGDIAETIALTWVATRRANRDPALSEIVEALATLGRSELPKRIETWLDACDETGRHVLIKLITGTLRIDRPRESGAVSEAATQNELFRAAPKKDTSGTIAAIMLYAERTNARARTSPLRCTFGVWNGDTLAPIGHCEVAPSEADPIERFIADNTTARFGPVRQVRHDREVALVVELAFTAIAPMPRRKAGLTLRAPRFIRIVDGAAPADAASLAALEDRLKNY